MHLKIEKIKNVLKNCNIGVVRLVYNVLLSLIGTEDSKLSFGLYFYFFTTKNKMKYRELREVKNIYQGKRCFILGTGPSLTIDDLDKIKNEISFGTNTILKIYDKTEWRPDYYCIIDPNTYSNLEEEIKKRKIENLFYPNNRIRNNNVSGRCFALDHSDIWKMYMPRVFKFTKFSKNIEKKVYDGASVIYAAMQIAVYMGFGEIYLLGVDCNYSVNNTRHANGMEYTNYNYRWTENTALSMIEGFKVAKRYADKNGIKIYNATRGGMLEVFERVNLDEVVSGG